MGWVDVADLLIDDALAAETGGGERALLILTGVLVEELDEGAAGFFTDGFFARAIVASVVIS